MTAASRLLKSWATLPASRPTASSFCAWRSWSSRARRGRMSRAMANSHEGEFGMFTTRALISSGTRSPSRVSALIS
jgi:hypothetical protein